LCFNGTGVVDEIYHPGGDGNEVSTSVAALIEGVIQTMMINKLKTMSGFLLLLSSVGGLASLTRAAEPTEALTAKTFAQYQKQIKPQPGESRWMDVPWFLDLHEARQKAAKEGKPLFIYSSGGATGIGSC